MDLSSLHTRGIGRKSCQQPSHVGYRSLKNDNGTFPQEHPELTDYSPLGFQAAYRQRSGTSPQTRTKDYSRIKEAIGRLYEMSATQINSQPCGKIMADFTMQSHEHQACFPAFLPCTYAILTRIFLV